jgi:tRNA(fMet)-specific endonuclease VapC
MALFMLDTDAASYLLKGSSASLDARIRQLQAADICISAVTRAEIMFGLRRKGEGATRLDRLIGVFLESVQCLPWEEQAADRFGAVAAALELAGQPIGDMDTMIGSHALAVDATLITNNHRHFSRISDLKIDPWSHSH